MQIFMFFFLILILPHRQGNSFKKSLRTFQLCHITITLRDGRIFVTFNKPRLLLDAMKTIEHGHLTFGLDFAQRKAASFKHFLYRCILYVKKKPTVESLLDYASIANGA